MKSSKNSLATEVNRICFKIAEASTWLPDVNRITHRHHKLVRPKNRVRHHAHFMCFKIAQVSVLSLKFYVEQLLLLNIWVEHLAHFMCFKIAQVSVLSLKLYVERLVMLNIWVEHLAHFMSIIYIFCSSHGQNYRTAQAKIRSAIRSRIKFIDALIQDSMTTSKRSLIATPLLVRSGDELPITSLRFFSKILNLNTI